VCDPWLRRHEPPCDLGGQSDDWGRKTNTYLVKKTKLVAPFEVDFLVK